MRRLHLAHALLPEGLRRNVSLTLDEEGTVLEVGRAEEALALDGLALPGLVNAHAHIELSGTLVHGSSLIEWVSNLYRVDDRDTDAMQAAIEEAIAFGTAAIADVTNTGRPEPLLARSDLCGVVHREVLGIDEVGLPGLELRPVEGFEVRVSPHAPYSTSPDRIVAAASEPGPKASIHLDEDPAERRFLHDGGGPWADFIRLIGRDLRVFEPPGCSPTEYLRRLGVLSELALVHCVGATGDDLDAIATSGTTVVLCPRSNLHIGGGLPDVGGMIERGIPLALGTDSLASVADLDLLKEVRALMQAFPEVHPEVWLQAATREGAGLLDQPHLGVFEPGKRPGVVLVEGCARDLGGTGPIERRWLVRPGRVG
ncbi:MAG TPA: amidohydrolase family protein [Myxococcota bacterium]|nr:amidohydrolase family protein [Myxococcota bacterium]